VNDEYNNKNRGDRDQIVNLHFNDYMMHGRSNNLRELGIAYISSPNNVEDSLPIEYP
jgi:hypothetical protein